MASNLRRERSSVSASLVKLEDRGLARPVKPYETKSTAQWEVTPRGAIVVNIKIRATFGADLILAQMQATALSRLQDRRLQFEGA
ncbi:MAG: hypothetical protein ACRYGG_02100 [Janthinobacterium lividum]